MRRKPFVCGNWKMNMTTDEAQHLISALVTELRDLDKVEVAVAPPFTLLASVGEAIRGTNIKLAAQNVHAQPKGAYTGEVSVPMLKDLGVEWVIVGHSERRQYFGETDTSVAEKLASVLGQGLKPIFALGETLEERESERTLEVVGRQLEVGLSQVDGIGAMKLVVAYEPVWAIGTGKTATPDQAEEVHAFIRSTLNQKYGADTGESIRIQYGGSLKPANADELLAKPNIDGGLVGGASLVASDYASICRSASANA